MMKQCLWSAVVSFLLTFCSYNHPRAQERFSLVYDGATPLADVQIDGSDAVIHSQGLYVTEKFYYVTGRLETTPKRALLLRFDRSNTSRYEYLDITPARRRADAGRLDHPGGIDCDGTKLWIPVALSLPAPPSVVLSIKLNDATPLRQQRCEVAFYVDDHIGALAVNPEKRLLVGANWDTRKVYIWSTEGTLRHEIDRSRLIEHVNNWGLAVQDWKSAAALFPDYPGILIAGGIDKSPLRDMSKSAAVVELLDPIQRRRLARIHLDPVNAFDGPPTREGLAVTDGRLLLLPADLGRGATILSYRIQIQRPFP